MHCEASLRPVASENLPSGHLPRQIGQLTLPVLDANCPGKHGRQTAPVAPSARLPLGQEAQPGAAQVLGSAGSRSTEVFAYVPGTAVHSVQVSTPSGRCPTLQGITQRSPLPNTPWLTRSGRHSRQTADSKERPMNGIGRQSMRCWHATGRRHWEKG